ncbi:MAG: hypothetical protein DRJ18_00880 [Candidatus Methanomethylicota archaeon]|nr:MAG: hypothetical protein DRJ18_00880 [Candidatus Verstraetearchaeota archaeon]
MISIEVKMLATLRGLLGRDSIDLTFSSEDEVTVRKALARLGELIDDRVKERLFKPNSTEVQPDVLVLVNGAEIGALDGLETKLKNGDTLILLPTVHGGA